MGLGDFVKGVGDAVENTAKVGGAIASHTLDPTKWDNAARFLGDHGDDIAKVGWDIAKDQINPMKADFWLNAGTLALSAATGGAAAAPLMAARAAVAARTAKGVAETVSVGSKIAKGVEIADKTSDAVRIADKAGDAIQVADKAAEASKMSKVLSKGEAFVDAATKDRSVSAITKGREALGMQPLGSVTRGKIALGNKIMAGGGETPGMFRRMAATSVAGQKSVMPSLRSGEAAKTATQLQDDLWRGSRLVQRQREAEGAEGYVDVMKDPEKAVSKKVFGDGSGETKPARQPRSGQSTVGSGAYTPAATGVDVIRPQDNMSVGYPSGYSSGQTSSSYSSPRPAVGGSTYTTSSTEVRDPYKGDSGGTSSVGAPLRPVGSGGGYGSGGASASPGRSSSFYGSAQSSAGAPMSVRDPYKKLVQPRSY